MFQPKYLIIIGVVLALLIICYLFLAMADNKKHHLRTYQKTMSLEARLTELEKKIPPPPPRPNWKNNTRNHAKNDSLVSPIYSITYQSDMIKNGNLSAKYADLSDTEARNLIKNIKDETKNSPPKTDNETDTINIKVDDLVKGQIVPLESKSDTAEYQKILDSLVTTNISKIYPEDDDIFSENKGSTENPISNFEDSLANFAESENVKNEKKNSTKKIISDFGTDTVSAIVSKPIAKPQKKKK